MIIKKEEFCLWIENHKIRNKIGYIESVIAACDIFDIRYDLVPILLNQQIVLKIEAEAKEVNLIKNTDTSLKSFL